jgi:hypothetical protein
VTGHGLGRSNFFCPLEKRAQLRFHLKGKENELYCGLFGMVFMGHRTAKILSMCER